MHMSTLIAQGVVFAFFAAFGSPSRRVVNIISTYDRRRQVVSVSTGSRQILPKKVDVHAGRKRALYHSYL